MILVTGGLGFIGSHTVQALLDAGESCLLVQRSHPEAPAGRFSAPVAVEQADVRDLDALLAIGQRHQISGIVHLAGSMPWPPSAEPPVRAARRSLGSLFNVIEAAQEWGVGRVALASTIGVYGRAREPFEGPLTEDMPLSMSAPHLIPTFKKISELLGGHLGDVTGMEIIHLRISGTWGPLGHHPDPFFAAPQLIHAAARGTAPALSGVGGRMRASPTHRSTSPQAASSARPGLTSPGCGQTPALPPRGTPNGPPPTTSPGCGRVTTTEPGSPPGSAPAARSEQAPGPDHGVDPGTRRRPRPILGAEQLPAPGRECGDCVLHRDLGLTGCRRGCSCRRIDRTMSNQVQGSAWPDPGPQTAHHVHHRSGDMDVQGDGQVIGVRFRSPGPQIGLHPPNPRRNLRPRGAGGGPGLAQRGRGEIDRGDLPAVRGEPPGLGPVPASRVKRPPRGQPLEIGDQVRVRRSVGHGVRMVTEGP